MFPSSGVGVRNIHHFDSIKKTLHQSLQESHGAEENSVFMDF
jgi:hypothetical protein